MSEQLPNQAPETELWSLEKAQLIAAWQQSDSASVWLLKEHAHQPDRTERRQEDWLTSSQTRHLPGTWTSWPATAGPEPGPETAEETAARQAKLRRWLDVHSWPVEQLFDAGETHFVSPEVTAETFATEINELFGQHSKRQESGDIALAHPDVEPPCESLTRFNRDIAHIEEIAAAGGSSVGLWNKDDAPSRLWDLERAGTPEERKARKAWREFSDLQWWLGHISHRRQLPLRPDAATFNPGDDEACHLLLEKAEALQQQCRCAGSKSAEKHLELALEMRALWMQSFNEADAAIEAFLQKTGVQRSLAESAWRVWQMNNDML